MMQSSKASRMVWGAEQVFGVDLASKFPVSGDVLVDPLDLCEYPWFKGSDANKQHNRASGRWSSPDLQGSVCSTAVMMSRGFKSSTESPKSPVLKGKNLSKHIKSPSFTERAVHRYGNQSLTLKSLVWSHLSSNYTNTNLVTFVINFSLQHLNL